MQMLKLTLRLRSVFAESFIQTVRLLKLLILTWDVCVAVFVTFLRGLRVLSFDIGTGTE